MRYIYLTLKYHVVFNMSTNPKCDCVNRFPLLEIHSAYISLIALCLQFDAVLKEKFLYIYTYWCIIIL